MTGYVKNVSMVPQYIMKRTVAPMEEIPIEDVIDRYKDETNTNNAKAFVRWLRKYIFESSSVWEINIKSNSKSSKVTNCGSDSQDINKSGADSNKGTSGTDGVDNNKEAGKLHDDAGISDKESSKERKVRVITKESMRYKLDAAKLVSVSYKKCAELAAKCSDPRVLKEALQRASTSPRKAKTCQILRDRLAELA